MQSSAAVSFIAPAVSLTLSLDYLPPKCLSFKPSTGPKAQKINKQTSSSSIVFVEKAKLLIAKNHLREAKISSTIAIDTFVLFSPTSKTIAIYF